MRSKLLIVIPHLNNYEKLVRCLNSINKHVDENCNHSVLVVDDNSEEDIKDKIKNLKIDLNIGIIKLGENSGVSKARNTGIIYATDNCYDFITFVDCDDHLVGSLELKMYDKNDLTIFESIETEDLYKEFDNYSNNIIKTNWNKFKNFPELINEYAKRPHKVPTLTSCWAKVYNLNIIKKNLIFFNERMHTFEDVQFLLRFLLLSETCIFREKILYAHTNSQYLNTATYAAGRPQSAMFGFLQIVKPLRKLFEKYDEEKNFNQKDFLASYYSITFIRLASKSKNANQKIKLYKFLKKRVASPLVKIIFKNYDYKLAEGRKLFAVLIKNNLSLLLCIFVLLLAKKRYGKRRNNAKYK